MTLVVSPVSTTKMLITVDVIVVVTVRSFDSFCDPRRYLYRDGLKYGD